MNLLYFFLVVVFLMFLSIIVIYKIFTNQMHKLFLLDKRQQQYIADLNDYDIKLAIKQKLFFCVLLSMNTNTRKYGIRQLKNHFNISEDIIENKNKLLQYFIAINNCKTVTFRLQNCKYTIIYK